MRHSLLLIPAALLLTPVVVWAPRGVIPIDPVWHIEG
jgi:hypothetical protein